MNEALSFGDVLLAPTYSEINSRSEIDLSVEMGAGLKLRLPVISSPMDTVSESNMAIVMEDNGGVSIIHRYCSMEKQAEMVRTFYERRAGNVGAAVGMTGDFLERADMLRSAGANLICVDVAHGHHQMMRECLTVLKTKFGDSIHIMAGNVATLEAFNDLADWGADSIRVGIGGGSICSTRVQTGHGVPTLQSVFDCSGSDRDVMLVADGGIKTSGDIVKALAAGADAVMVGSMLAGTAETPGPIHRDTSGKEYKVYRGMASRSAQIEWRGKSSSPEGISTTIPYKGSVQDILADIAGNVKSGLSYSGARNIKELRHAAKFIKQTGAGQMESGTHILKR